MYSPAVFKRQFTCAEDVDEFAASPSRTQGAAALYTIRTAAFGYYKVGAYPQAERYFNLYLESEPHDVEVIEALAHTHVQLGSLQNAMKQYQNVLALQPFLQPALLEVAKINIQMAKAVSEDPDLACEYLRNAFKSLEKCRSNNTGRISTAAILVLQDIYKMVTSHPACASPLRLLPLMLATAGLDETRGRSILHVHLVQAMVKNNQLESAWSYATSKRLDFSGDEPWLTAIIALFDELSLGCVGPQKNLDILEFRLWLSANQSYLFLQSATATVAERARIIVTFDTLLESAYPVMSQLADSASMHRWTEIYGEYAAFGRLFRAMSKLRSISDKSVSTLVYHQNEIQEIFTELRLVLSYREHHLDENLAKLATQRQSSAVNLFLALFSCFSTDFLLGPIVPSPDEALNDYLRTHDQGVLCKVQLPTFRSADFIWDENVQGTLKTTLTWVTDNLTKMHNAAVSQDIPDLASFVNCSAWHFQDGSIRTLLRSTFPRLPESRQLSKHKNDKTVRRPNPTIADMEAFLLILLVQRHMWAISKMGVTTLGEITLTCALGTWRPTAQQERFWRTALWLHGKKLWGSQCAALGTMEDENYYGCIQEIRGNITYSSKGSRDSHAYHRNIWGALGLLYSETLNRSSSDRYAEARDYLTCWKDWPNSPLIERSTRNFHILPEADQWERFAITEQEIDNALILADGNHDKSFSEPPSHQSPSRVMEEMRALRAISKSISSPYGNARGSLPNSPLTSTSRKTSDISLTSSTDAAPLKDVGAATVDPSFRQMESQDLDMSAISMSDSILAQGSDILSDFDIEPVEEASGECTPTLAFQSARTHRHLQMLTDLRRGDFKDPSFTPTAIPRAAKPPHPFHSRLPISPRTTENKLDVPPELPRSPFSNPGSAGRPTLPRSLVQTQSSPSPIPTLPSTLPSSLMSSPSRSPRLRKQDTTSTPKRDPLELRGGRGDLSELRKRAVVARSLNLFGPSSHKPLAEQSSNAQQKQPEMSARLARQMRVLEQLRAQA